MIKSTGRVVAVEWLDPTTIKIKANCVGVHRKAGLVDFTAPIEDARKYTIGTELNVSIELTEGRDQ